MSDVWYIGTLRRKWNKFPSAHRTRAQSRQGARRSAAEYYAKNPEGLKELLFIARRVSSTGSALSRIVIEEIKDGGRWRTLSEHLKHERERK